MYIFGNASQLSMQSPLWKSILRILEKAGLCGQHIYLYCQKHSNPNDPNNPNLTRVGWSAEIPLEGGCMKDCGEMMECGHVCIQIIKLQD